MYLIIHKMQQLHHINMTYSNIFGFAVFRIWHIFFGKNYRYDTFITMSSGKFIADGNLSLFRNEYPYQFINTGGKIMSFFPREQLYIQDFPAFSMRYL